MTGGGSQRAEAGGGGEPRAVAVVALISNSLAIVSGLGIIVLMLLTTSDVALRAVSDSGISGSIEITQVALVATVFAGMMSAELAKVHVRTPILTERLPLRVATALRLFGAVLAVILVAWASVYSWRVGLASYEAGEFQFGLAQVPIWPAKLVLSTGLTGLLVACVLNVYLLVRRGARRDAGAPLAAHGIAAKDAD